MVLALYSIVCTGDRGCFACAKEGTDIGPVISARQLERIENQVERAKAVGAKALTGGQKPRQEVLQQLGNLGKGHFYEPTVLTGVTPKNLVFK